MANATTDRTYRVRAPRWVWVVFGVGLVICMGLSASMLLRLGGMDRRMPDVLTPEQRRQVSPFRHLWWTALIPLGIELPPVVVVAVLWRRQRREHIRLTDEGIVYRRAFGKGQLIPWTDVTEVRRLGAGSTGDPPVGVYCQRRRLLVADFHYPERAELLTEITERAGLTDAKQSRTATIYTRPTQEQAND
ncbi:MAG TPA: hypothetical protein QGH10_13070 [Armatimonadota bacterium]|nr:hypothetical protein [Armatimonadota bacterium]